MLWWICILVLLKNLRLFFFLLRQNMFYSIAFYYTFLFIFHTKKLKGKKYQRERESDLRWIERSLELFSFHWVSRNCKRRRWRITIYFLLSGFQPCLLTYILTGKTQILWAQLNFTGPKFIFVKIWEIKKKLLAAKLKIYNCI